MKLLAGLASAALGVFAGCMIYLYPEGLRAPAWIGFTAAGVFIAAGAAIAAGACEAKKLEGWLGVLTVAGLLAPAVWIALGPGPRACTVTLPFLSTDAAEVICRGAFGVGALLAIVLLVLMVNRVIRL